MARSKKQHKASREGRKNREREVKVNIGMLVQKKSRVLTLNSEG
jgi:hypothetical protein